MVISTAKSTAIKLLAAINRSLEVEPKLDEADPVRRMRGIQRKRVEEQEVEKISGLIPSDVDAISEYRKHVLRKHR